MIPPELRAKIRRLHFAEHWKVGTIAAQLDVHPDTVRLAIETSRTSRGRCLLNRATDPYVDFLQETLNQYPRLTGTRLFEMVRGRGYQGSVIQLRRVIRLLRPTTREAFLKLSTLAGEQAQADWAHFGEVKIGRARRRLSCFVMALSFSRALYLEFFYDQKMESLLVGHIHAFEFWGGTPRQILYDNMRSVVTQRISDAIAFHPRLLELAGHYHFEPRVCRPARGNEKGRVERAIHYVRNSFFAARSFTSITDLNAQAMNWIKQIAHKRRWQEDDNRNVEQALEEEKPRLLPLAAHRFESDLILSVRSGKTCYIRFDGNDYSIPPEFVGRALMLVVSPETVRLLHDSTKVAHHRRSYDRHQLISDPAHIDAVLAQKKKALGGTAKTRLIQAVPKVEEFLQAALLKGESISKLTRQLILLLDDYGAAEVAAAVSEALAKETPRVSSVAFILARRFRQKKNKTIPVDLSRHPHLADLSVPTHQLEVYDELTSDDDQD